MGEGGKRLYVGNLYPEVTQDELKERFNKFGSVSGVEIKHKKDIDGRPTQTFGFIDMVMTDANLNNCITTLSNTKWKGYMLRIQQAKESFMSRLARERAEKEKSASGAPYDPLSLVKSKQEAEGIESKPEKKIVSKHLGGDRSESDAEDQLLLEITQGWVNEHLERMTTGAATILPPRSPNHSSLSAAPTTIHSA